MLFVYIGLSTCLQLVIPSSSFMSLIATSQSFIFVMSSNGHCLDPMQVFFLGLGPIMLFLASEEG